MTRRVREHLIPAGLAFVLIYGGAYALAYAIEAVRPRPLAPPMETALHCLRPPVVVAGPGGLQVVPGSFTACQNILLYGAT